jgi:hypothetical protein
MTLSVKTVTRTQSGGIMKVRDATNTLKTVQKGSRRDATGLKDFYGNLTVGLSSSSVSGSINRAGTGTAPTRTVTATPNGGVAPYTYLWTRTDGGSHAWNITSPTSATTAFSTLVSTNTEQTATFICTVTDATGQSAASGAVFADCWNDGGGL